MEGTFKGARQVTAVNRVFKKEGRGFFMAHALFDDDVSAEFKTMVKGSGGFEAHRGRIIMMMKLLKGSSSKSATMCAQQAWLMIKLKKSWINRDTLDEIEMLAVGVPVNKLPFCAFEISVLLDLPEVPTIRAAMMNLTWNQVEAIEAQGETIVPSYIGKRMLIERGQEAEISERKRYFEESKEYMRPAVLNIIAARAFNKAATLNGRRLGEIDISGWTESSSSSSLPPVDENKLIKEVAEAVQAVSDKEYQTRQTVGYSTLEDVERKALARA